MSAGSLCFGHVPVGFLTSPPAFLSLLFHLDSLSCWLLGSLAPILTGQPGGLEGFLPTQQRTASDRLGGHVCGKALAFHGLRSSLKVCLERGMFMCVVNFAWWVRRKCPASPAEHP